MGNRKDWGAVEVTDLTAPGSYLDTSRFRRLSLVSRIGFVYDNADVTYTVEEASIPADTVAKATGTHATSVDFTSADVTFDVVVDGGTPDSITLDADYSDHDGVVTEINSQLTNSGAVCSHVNGVLRFTSTTAGATSSVQIDNYAETDPLSRLGGASAGLFDQTVTGVDADCDTFSGDLLDDIPSVADDDADPGPIVSKVDVDLDSVAVPYLRTVFSADGAAALVGSGATDADFTGADVTFDLTVDQTTVAITLDDDYTDSDGVVDEINTQFGAVVASQATDVITITSPTQGADAYVEIANYLEAGAASAALADGVDTGLDGVRSFAVIAAGELKVK